MTANVRDIIMVIDSKKKKSSILVILDAALAR
jgi:hypothetical protein